MVNSTPRRAEVRVGAASALAVAVIAAGAPAGAQEAVDLADVLNPLVVQALQGGEISAVHPNRVLPKSKRCGTGW